MSDNFCYGENCAKGSEFSNIFVGNEYRQALQRQKQAFLFHSKKQNLLSL